MSRIFAYAVLLVVYHVDGAVVDDAASLQHEQVVEEAEGEGRWRVDRAHNRAPLCRVRT